MEHRGDTFRGSHNLELVIDSELSSQAEEPNVGVQSNGHLPEGPPPPPYEEAAHLIPSDPPIITTGVRSIEQINLSMYSGGYKGVGWVVGVITPPPL